MVSQYNGTVEEAEGLETTKNEKEQLRRWECGIRSGRIGEERGEERGGEGEAERG